MRIDFPGRLAVALTMMSALIASCAHQSGTSRLGQAREAIALANAAFSEHFKAGDTRALVRDYYANDAILAVDPRSVDPIRGWDAIGNVWGGWVGSNATIALKTGTTAGLCDVVYETGEYEIQAAPGPETKYKVLGSYLAVWRLLPAGWRVEAHSFVSAKDGEPPLTREPVEAGRNPSVEGALRSYYAADEIAVFNPLRHGVEKNSWLAVLARGKFDIQPIRSGGACDVVYRTGRYRLAVTVETRTQIEEGKFLFVWEKSGRGRWQLKGVSVVPGGFRDE